MLLALLDADYEFLYIHVGANGTCGHAAIFGECFLKKAMNKKLLSFHDQAVVQATFKMCNHHIIGDEAFPLQDLMKPFPQTATLVKRTKKIQRRVTKYILDLPFRRDTNYEQRPLLLDVIPLCCWFEFLDILFFDKLIQGHVTIDNDSLPPLDATR